MAEGNVNGARGLAIVKVDRGLEMALYDNLPRRWRILIGSLPVLQQIAPILQYRAVLGEERAYQEVVRIFRARFPGWEPPDGIAGLIAADAGRRRRLPTRRGRQRQFFAKG